MPVTAWRRFGPYAVLACLTLLAYGTALGNGYVWDDHYFLTDSTWVSNLREAWDASFAPLFGQRAYVRPLPLMTLYIEAIATGRDPVLSHLVNLLLHFACSALVYLLARRASDDSLKASAGRWLPLILASLFTVHPALSEDVIWISSRFDLMATLFMLLGLWFAGNDRLTDVRRASMVGASFFVAAFCKESAAVLPMALGAYALLRGAAKHGSTHVQLRDAFTPREWKAYAAILILGTAYLAVRFHILDGANLIKNASPGPEEHVVRIGLALYKYLQLTLIPFIGNSPHHTFTWTTESSLATYWPQLLLSTALIVTAIGLAIRNRSAGWWLLAWLAGLLPVLQIVPLTIGGNLVHQRFMYFPTAVLLGFAPYVLSRVELTALGRRAAMALSAAIIAISVAVCWTIVPVWKNDLALWSWTVAMDPTSVEARENLIKAYLDNAMFDEMQEQLEYFAEHQIRFSHLTVVNLGILNYRRENFDAAIYYYNLAYAQRDEMPPSLLSRVLSNMAIAYAVDGKVPKAKHFIIESLEADRTNTVALAHLMAFCHDQQIGFSDYRETDIERAKLGIKNTDTALMKYQPEIYGHGEFCPYSSPQ